MIRQLCYVAVTETAFTPGVPLALKARSERKQGELYRRSFKYSVMNQNIHLVFFSSHLLCAARQEQLESLQLLPTALVQNAFKVLISKLKENTNRNTVK